MSENVLKDVHKTYTASVQVQYDEKNLVNPNGRGYSADNVRIDRSENLIEVKVSANTMDDLRQKVWTIISTIQEQS
jgi:hypothetical protein